MHFRVESAHLDASTGSMAVADLVDATSQTSFLAGALTWNPSIYNLNALRFHLTNPTAVVVGEVTVPGLTSAALGGSESPRKSRRLRRLSQATMA